MAAVQETNPTPGRNVKIKDVAGTGIEIDPDYKPDQEDQPDGNKQSDPLRQSKQVSRPTYKYLAQFSDT